MTYSQINHAKAWGFSRRSPKKVRWYHWLNPFFYVEMIVLAYLQRALNSLCYNVTENLKEEIEQELK